MEQVKKKNIYNQNSFWNSTFFFINTSLGKKIICHLMKHGKKSKAIKLLNSVFYHLWILSKKDIFSLILFKKGLLNLMPFYEQYTYKQSGQTNIETILVYKKKRRLFLLFKNLKTDLKQKKKQTSAFILASLIYNSYLKIGKYKDFQQERINLLKNYPQLRFRW